MFPLGASVAVAALERDPHPLLAQLRAREPVSWVPALGGWLVTRRDIVARMLRDPQTFTVADPRFSTARVVGPSMLSLDGPEHKRHRDPFAAALRGADSGAQLAAFTAAAAAQLVAAIAPAGRGELRREVAGPLAVAVIAQLLGLGQAEPRLILSWYEAIAGAVSAMAAQDGPPASTSVPGSPARADPGAEAFGMLRASLEAAMAGSDGRPLLAQVAAGGALSTGEVVSNAAVLMFGGIETTEGMICNAMLHLLSHPDQAAALIADPELAAGAIEESLRLEPAAAVVDRYATADVTVGAAAIRRGDLVTLSLAAANRDPAFFADPDRFDVRRPEARLHLAFARGPHFCIGAQLARLEARAAILAVLDQLPGLRLDPAGRPEPRGLVFRKPPELLLRWDAGQARWLARLAAPVRPPGSTAWPGPASSR